MSNIKTMAHKIIMASTIYAEYYLPGAKEKDYREIIRLASPFTKLKIRKIPNDEAIHIDFSAADLLPNDEKVLTIKNVHHRMEKWQKKFFARARRRMQREEKITADDVAHHAIGTRRPLDS